MKVTQLWYLEVQPLLLGSKKYGTHQLDTELEPEVLAFRILQVRKRFIRNFNPKFKTIILVKILYGIR